MLEPIDVLTIISVSIRPSENSFSFYNTVFPVPNILSIVDIGKCAFSIELAIFEASLIDPRAGDIPALAIFDPIFKLPLIIPPIAKTLPALPMRHIAPPPTLINIPLKRIRVHSNPLSLILFNLPLINTSIIIDISAMAMSTTLEECALVVGAVFEEELTFAMEFVVFPTTQVETIGGLHLG